MLLNLKRLRHEYGISQPSINKYENHNIEPEIEILKRMADYFNTSIDYIVGHTEIRRKIEHTEAFQLNQFELDVITRFRLLDDEEKKCIDTTIRTFLRK